MKDDFKLQKTALTTITENSANPRTISDSKFDKLVNSLLIFPKMMSLRPIVLDNKVILGGNMRKKALSYIASLSEPELISKIKSIRDFKNKKKEEQNEILEFWLQWLDKPFAYTIQTKDLSDAEKQEFIIKDNVAFGEWEFSKLTSEFDKINLSDWGVDIHWSEIHNSNTSEESFNEDIQNYSNEEFTEQDKINLPEELQDININPQELQKLKGDDEVALDRIIIVYPKNKVDKISTLLGLNSIDKVIYKIEEIPNLL